MVYLYCSGKLSRIAPVQLFRCGLRACATHPRTHNADIRISQNFAKNTFADGTETAPKFTPSKVFRYTVARTYIHVRKVYYTIHTYYAFNSAWYRYLRCYTRLVKIPGFSRKKSGHRDIACISGIIPENLGWLAGMHTVWYMTYCGIIINV